METKDNNFALRQKIRDLEQDKAILRDTNYKLKDEFAEFRVQYSTMRRLIDKATVFVIGYDDQGYQVTVERRANGKWSVCQLGFVINCDDKWEYERLPSNRSDDFLERTRFTFDVAMEKANKFVVTENKPSKIRENVLSEELKE